MAEQIFPEVAVGALIFNKDDKVFLMKSYKWRGKYTMPGGHVELGETLEAALKREIKEETGLSIFDIDFVIMHEFIHDNAFWKKKHFIFLDYACRTIEDNIVLNDEGQEYIWASLEEVENLDIDPYTKKAIDAVAEKRRAWFDKVGNADYSM